MLFILMYFGMGITFTYLAYINATETLFNPLTILFLLIAAYDFYYAFRILKMFINRKKK